MLDQYRGEEPLASFLKKIFAGNKKFGSTDRKQISNLCYCYFRTAKLFNGDSIEERILKGLFLCSTQSNEILAALKPEWNDKIHLPAPDKFSILNARDSMPGLFPWTNELSGGIDPKKFAESFLIQPDLFLRIRPHHAEAVLLKLSKTGINYEFIPPFSIRLPNNFKVENYFEINREVVVQDYSSQRIAEFLFPGQTGTVRPAVWDCCAGSGGKSILAKDILGDIDLTVSDVRESILLNLQSRFRKAGINNYQNFVADLSQENTQYSIINNQYSTILADVPCSGSGTWGRTPEQLYYFDEKKINEYAALQQKIVSNAAKHLKPGGHLLYITCSVFKKENEEMVNLIKQKLHLESEKTELLKGYDMKADTMFVALFKKKL
ncbi:MAG: Fmu (Sun) domain-containing protein [Sphingobacteriales bacterium]|nr:Fmu (Sun) domain-containing protein [Sphingobacteriales bacterium]